MARSSNSTIEADQNQSSAPGSGSSLRRVVILLAATTLWLSARPLSAAPLTLTAPAAAKTDKVPEGLTASDWSSIHEAYDASRHTVFATNGGYAAHNPGQSWLANFNGRGFEVIPHGASWSWGLDLISYGREGAEFETAVPACIDAEGSRVSYQWSDSLTEWFVNEARGLEHGFTVHQAPATRAEFDLHSGENGPADQQPLQFTLSVRGGLVPHISTDGRNVTFANANGGTVVTYFGLIVVDADGDAVPAHFEIVSEGLRLSVNDQNALYPLTIDPVAQQAFLKASNAEASDLFGYAVAASGDTVVISAKSESSSATGVNGNQALNSLPLSGAAYVFVRDGATWSQQAYLKASNTGSIDAFGRSVAISGDTIVIGADLESSNATGVNGNQADNSAEFSGAAYVFVRNGTIWSQQAYLKASNTEERDNFGVSVAVSGDTIVVGAHTEDSSATGVDGDQTDNSATYAGAAYVFVRSGTSWSQQAYLKASNAESGDFFGRTVAVSGDTVLVGADHEESGATGVNGNQSSNNTSNAGAAYVFVRNGTTWTQQAYLKASNTGEGDSFGSSVAVSGNTLLVGAFSENSSAPGVNGDQDDNSAENSGAAYVFVRNGATWNQQAYLKASNPDADDYFGRSVSLSGDILVVGAIFEDSNAKEVDGNQADNSASGAGAAYVFVRTGTTWNQQAYLKASNTGAPDHFASAVAVSGDTVLVGASDEDSNATGVDGDQTNNLAPDSGAAYVFTGFQLDIDGDGVFGSSDNCPQVANPNQEDADADGAGDACDLCPGFNDNLDGDSDGIPDDCDVCPDVTAILGDVSGDLTIDSGDIAEFIVVLLDPGSASAAEFCAADVNSDALVDILDVQPFAEVLLNQ